MDLLSIAIIIAMIGHIERSLKAQAKTCGLGGSKRGETFPARDQGINLTKTVLRFSTGNDFDPSVKLRANGQKINRSWVAHYERD